LTQAGKIKEAHTEKSIFLSQLHENLLMNRTLFFTILLAQVLHLGCIAHSVQQIKCQDPDDFPRDTGYLTVLSAVKLDTFKNILDVGCGAGAITHYIASKTTALVTGIDMSQEIINQARQTYKAHNLTFSVHNICDCLLPKNRYDLIVSINCMHWIKDLQLVMHKISESLQPNGTFLAAVQHQDHYLYKPMLDVSKKKNWQDFFGQSAQTPWYPHTQTSLRAIIENSGMHVISIFIWRRKLSFKNPELFIQWLESWMDYIPHVAQLPKELKKIFIAEVGEHFLQTITLNADRSFDFTTPILIVHAKK
jgi:trans-aconitate methyltransferase